MPTHGTRPGSATAFFPLRSGGRHSHGYGTAWVPWGAPYWDDDGYFWNDSSYEQPPQQPATPPPQVVVVQDREPHQPSAPPPSPKFVEVPDSKDGAAAQPLPPAVFVLQGGQRFESRNYVLTAQSLEITEGGQRREIPLRTLDINATIAANRQRGIDLTIPHDRTAVFVSF
jgi:hypothetical protein